MQQYIDHTTHAIYSGDRAHWRDIPVTSAQPSPHHRPVVEDGAHVGWEVDEEALAAERNAMQLSFAQLLIGLVAKRWITEAEGEAWLEGRLPAPVNALIASLPQEMRFEAKARAIRPSVILRNNPLVMALATAQGKTDMEIDEFFTTYAAV